MFRTRDSVADIWGARAPHGPGQAWPARIDERVEAEPDHWVQSACVLCSNGCGCDIGVKDGRIVGVRGRDVDVVNLGRMGPKGLNGWEANNSPDRLTTPLIRRHGRLEPASWDEAMDLIAERSREIRDRYTASAIGFYTSGQLFLEEYYTLAVIGKRVVPHAASPCGVTAGRTTLGVGGAEHAIHAVAPPQCMRRCRLQSPITPRPATFS